MIEYLRALYLSWYDKELLKANFYYLYDDDYFRFVKKYRSKVEDKK